MFGKPVTRIPGGSIKPPKNPLGGFKCRSCGRSIIQARLVYDSVQKKVILKCPCGAPI